MKVLDFTGEEYFPEVEDVHSIPHLVSLLPENAICVNIGARFGTSAMAMLEARSDIFVFSIDIDPCPDEFENLKKVELYDQHRLVRLLGRSQDIGKNFPDVDFVFVDGAHDFLSVTDDMKAWWPKTRHIMALHDYDRAICPAVKPAVDEFFEGMLPFFLSGYIVAFKREEIR